MDIALKYKILEKIIQSEDDVLLNEIDSLLKISQNNFWHDLSDKAKEAINNAKTELDRGEGIAHEQVMLEIRERFLK